MGRRYGQFKNRNKTLETKNDKIRKSSSKYGD